VVKGGAGTSAVVGGGGSRVGFVGLGVGGGCVSLGGLVRVGVVVLVFVLCLTGETEKVRGCGGWSWGGD